MKTALKVLSIVLKAITIIFSIIGGVMTITMVMLAKPAVNHVYDVVDETEDIDPDDEDQDSAMMAEAYRRTLTDPRIKCNKFVHAVAYCIGRFTSFVANL